MRFGKYRLVLGFVSLSISLALISCGGGGGSGASGSAEQAAVFGTAAAGAPVVGVVHLRDEAGNRRSQSTDAEGGFRFDITGLTPPFLLWVDGTANAKAAFFYSMAEAGGRVNITPATHAILAMALGGDVVAHYAANPGAPPPGSVQTDAAKQKIANLLVELFASKGVSGDFDLMNGQFDPDGSGFDEIMDVVDFKADGQHIEIVDRGTSTILFKQETSTGDVLVEKDPREVKDVVVSTIDALLEIKAILKAFKSKFRAAVPTYDELLAAMQSTMAADFIKAGQNREEYLAKMTADRLIGIEFENIALYRKMKAHHLGDVAPWSINELPSGYAQGVWCTLKYRIGNKVAYEMAAFARQTANGSWKWLGDRNPFRFGGVVQPESAYWRPTSTGNSRLRIFSGLRLRAEDHDRAAFNRLGIVAFDTFNSALPPYTDQATGNTYRALHSVKDPDPSLKYDFSPPKTWRSKYWEKDGLDIAAISDPEFVFVGYDAEDRPVHVWISLLDKQPIREAELWKDSWANAAAESTGNYFSKLSTVWGEAALPVIASDALDSARVPLEWELAPLGDYVASAEVYWANAANTWVGPNYIENPALCDASLDLADWKATSFDISGLTAFWPPVRGYNIIQSKDECQRRYFTEIDYRVVDPGSEALNPIAINEWYLLYETFGDSTLNRFRGWVDFFAFGLWTAEDDIRQIRLLNLAASTEIPIESNVYDRGIYYYTNSLTASNAWEPYYYSSRFLYFPAGTDIQPGQYRYEATTRNGDTIRTPDFTVADRIELQVVDPATMRSEWVDGDLRLSWTAPSDPNATYIRGWIFGGSTEDFIIGFNVPSSTEQFTIPKRVIESAKTLKGYTSATWQIQLRSSNQSFMQIARGTSVKVVIEGWQ
jgi:hypothetical protein